MHALRVIGFESFHQDIKNQGSHFPYFHLGRQIKNLISRMTFGIAQGLAL